MYRPQLLKRLTVLTNTKVKAFVECNIELAGALLKPVESRQGLGCVHQKHFDHVGSQLGIPFLKEVDTLSDRAA